MLTEQEILQEKEQLNEVAPLLAFLFGIFAKAGYDRNQAAQAARAAAAAAEQQAPGAATAVTQTGQPNPQAAAGNGNGYILDNRERITRGPRVSAMQAALGMPSNEQDGMFGPKTTAAVKEFQRSMGLRQDGIVGPNTMAAMQRRAASAGETPGNPVDDGGLGQRPYQYASKENTGNKMNEEITISGDAESLIRMMQLAGADGAKAVDAGDISQGSKPCSACGEVHSEHGCGNRNGDLARSIAMMADEDWDNSPDEDIKDFEATPPTNDLNKAKKSYPKVAGGDNPMALENNLRAKLSDALAKKKK